MAAVPAFEVVLDHTDPRHHDRMNAMLVELQAWARRHNVRHVNREEREIRPGVVRLRFTPGRAPAASRDQLSLTGRAG